MAGDWELLSGLILSESEAALATIEENHRPQPPAGAGQTEPQAAAYPSRPFASATGYVVEDPARLTVALLLSRLARHTRNIQKNPAVSLLVVESSKAPVHERMRATLAGSVVPVESKAAFEPLKKAYLAKFPRSEIFFTLPDFSFYRLEPMEIHWIGGFGRAGTYHFQAGKWQPSQGPDRPPVSQPRAGGAGQPAP